MKIIVIGGTGLIGIQGRELLPTQECVITFYPWYPRAVSPAAPRTCPSSFASESIRRTFPDTRQRHGGFVGLARRFYLSGAPWRSVASEMGDGFTGRFHRGPKRFAAARCSVPKSMQKPQSRGDATIAMNYWPEQLRSGVEPPTVAPSSNKRSPRSSLLIS